MTSRSLLPPQGTDFWQPARDYCSTLSSGIQHISRSNTVIHFPPQMTVFKLLHKSDVTC